jgi:glycosyltransferase involved in cell wall biosynthesis
MKILTNCNLPFSLAHGGWVIQIEQTMKALRELGLDVEYLRWWDEPQTGDIIHFFGRMNADQIRFAQEKKIKVVMAELLTAHGSRSMNQLRLQKLVMGIIARTAPRGLIVSFNWDAYRRADAFVALTSWQKYLMEFMFNADPARTFVVPNGVEECFFTSPPVARGPWLVCTATVTQRKRVLELAQAAVEARVPVWIIGKAYGDNDPYAQKFFELAKQNSQFVRYEGAVNDRVQLAAIYRAARGFVLLSVEESLSLSALEAVACECPVLLTDLPWARGTFTKGMQYCPIKATLPATAAILRRFYDEAPQMPAAPRPATWTDVAHQLLDIYKLVLAR